MSAHSVPSPPGSPRSAAHVWSDADDQRLAALWDEGLSSEAIARRMATTKGSVLGRAHRLLLAKRPSPIPTPDARLKTAEERARALAKAVDRLNSTVKATTLPAQPDLAAAAENHSSEPETPCAGNVVPVKAMSGAITDPRSCQYPIGHPKRPGFRFCNAPTEPAKPYCLAHCRIAFVGYRSDCARHSYAPDRVYVPTWMQNR